MPVAGQRPLGQQVVGCAPGGAPPASRGAARCAASAARGGEVRVLEAGDHRARPRPGPRRRGPAGPARPDRRRGPSRRAPRRAGRPGWRRARPCPRPAPPGVPRRRRRCRPATGGLAEHDVDLAVARPAEGAGAGEHRLVGLAAEHGVDHERLEPGVPGAADLGGAGVDLGGGEGDLAGVAQHGRVDVGGVVGVDDARRCCSRRPRCVSRTRSTVCCRVITPGQRPGGGAEDRPRRSTVAPGTGLPVWEYQSTKPWMPAWTITPTQERSSALSSRNHGRSDSIRAVAAVLSDPVARVRASAARSGRGAGRAGRGHMHEVSGVQNPEKTRVSVSHERRPRD